VVSVVKKEVEESRSIQGRKSQWAVAVCREERLCGSLCLLCVFFVFSSVKKEVGRRKTEEHPCRELNGYLTKGRIEEKEGKLEKTVINLE